ncbi:MAG: UDP-N-acetylmuramoyl-L-alanyl-D-glutamate--2,6-diaminopimelate ligase, partial [Oscillospiraceae bacterium]|nr:UDP-N-acetylmuramoyl-L-alanyl-D-glutamate--2,6-diaminopimelate ligase [Oscillospiraceae bacterium]
MKLCDLLKDIAVTECCADLETEISGVSYDSRNTKEGELFVAMTGYETDGHRFIPVAREKGAACVLCEKKVDDAACVVVEDSHAALAQLGRNWYGDPAASMTMIGVTGTNGKTTTTYLLKDILEKARGAKVGLIGTNQNMIGETILPTERTTPESFELQGLFRRMADEGCTHVVMEVSSHALYLKRVAGIRFAVGIFTNLTQDHLDFHKTMEEYCDAKALLFQQCDNGVYNIDDPWAQRLIGNAACKMVSIGEHSADLRAENIALDAQGIAFDAVTATENLKVTVGIPGGFMVYNTLGVLAAAQAVGVSLAESAKILATTSHVKGRVEVVPTDGDYTILIDYAHTPDALKAAICCAKRFTRGRVIAVFGAGGDREKE